MTTQTTDLRQEARAAADVLADRLASPTEVRHLPLSQGWWPQSLAHGALGVALLHIERARSGDGTWQRAHDWLACAAAEQAVGGDDSHLYYGVPALAFVVHLAAEDRPGQYGRALATLDKHVRALVRSRLEKAHARMDAGRWPALAEFDTIRGLTGLGALLLRREEHADLARDVLAYLVRLTEPVRHGGESLPGWWSDLAPSGKPSPAEFPGGHANNGVAHGISGPLALLSLAALRGITVPGQMEAIGRICSWLDRWQQHPSTGVWWPHWITRAQLGNELPGAGPARPSWCYGTAGFARTQQLAALATDDLARQRNAEQALLQAMTHPAQRHQTADLSLCHGFAGLAYLTQRSAEDAVTAGLQECLPELISPITAHPPTVLADQLLATPGGGDIGLLEGAAGIALALHSYQAQRPAVSGWDACLLIH
ncbi:lanthionine synthetase C family protein [Streptomyces sp. NBC_00237]|uniref:lanthionine synthetase C family protein n=1 Tax=Streptomyces sp. NBC_00237 TaxID=2975687 RepID=UPI00225335BB|nr:lanthionine synthetase C family protein [Streptomyces sp. NBC_00237]MCX5206721.1 lanthionine synthetase C family protein [Streptomyces sp. NBC_00237]